MTPYYAVQKSVIGRGYRPHGTPIRVVEVNGDKAIVELCVRDVTRKLVRRTVPTALVVEIDGVRHDEVRRKFEAVEFADYGTNSD